MPGSSWVTEEHLRACFSVSCLSSTYDTAFSIPTLHTCQKSEDHQSLLVFILRGPQMSAENFMAIHRVRQSEPKCWTHWQADITTLPFLKNITVCTWKWNIREKKEEKKEFTWGWSRSSIGYFLSLLWRWLVKSLSEGKHINSSISKILPMCLQRLIELLGNHFCFFLSPLLSLLFKTDFWCLSCCVYLARFASQAKRAQPHAGASCYSSAGQR